MRFGAFAVLPLPYVNGSLKEAEYALDTLKLDGVVMLASQSDGTFLGECKPVTVLHFARSRLLHAKKRSVSLNGTRCALILRAS